MVVTSIAEAWRWAGVEVDGEGESRGRAGKERLCPYLYVKRVSAYEGITQTSQ